MSAIRLHACRPCTRQKPATVPRRARDAVTAKVSSEDSIAVLRAAAVPLEGVDDAAAVSILVRQSVIMTNVQSHGDDLTACRRCAWMCTCWGLGSS
jgi:hypothetical protein